MGVLIVPFSCQVSVFMEVPPEPILRSVNVVAFGSELPVHVKCSESSMANPFGAIARKVARIPVSELAALVENLGNIQLQSMSPAFEEILFRPLPVGRISGQ